MTELEKTEIQQMIMATVAAMLPKNTVSPRDYDMSLAATLPPQNKEETGGIGPQDVAAPTLPGEQGKRTSDSFCWRHIGDADIQIYNLFIGFNGVVGEYGYVSNLTIGTSATYVYADITWTIDDHGSITGINLVTLATTSSFSTASMVVETDGVETGIHVPVAVFKYATGTWGSTVICQKRYLDGALMLDRTDGQWTTDTNRETLETFDQFSIEIVEAQGTDVAGRKYNRYIQLYNFEIGDDGAMLTAADTGWTDPTTGKTSQKVLVRKTTAEDQFRLHYKSINPIPDGTSTNVAIKWSDTLGGHLAVLPIAASNSEESGVLGTGARVVTGAQTGGDGSLIQLITNPLGNILPDGDSTDVAAKWDDTNSKWVKALPVDGTNDEQTAELGKGDRVVTGVKTGGEGKLLQLITQPLGEMGGGTPSGYTETSIPIIWRYDTSAHKWQYKKATVLVKDNTTDSTWTDAISFTEFND